MNRKKVSRYFFVVLIVMVIAAAWLTFKINTQKNIQIKTPLQQNSLDIFQGCDTAPLQVYMFMDYTCGHCRRFLNETYPKIKTKYINTGKIQFYIKPITFSVNQNVKNAHKMAICLNQYGDFTHLNELLLQEIQVIFSSEFLALTDEYVNRNTAFAECMYGGIADDYLNSNLKYFVANQFTGTPTFVIGNQVVKGFKDFNDFSKILDKQL